jgi:hypothetical protein
MADDRLIGDSLKRRGIQFISHTTPCDRIPNIFRNGGILSFNQRQTRGIPEPDPPHGWGSAGKKESLADFVICSFMPPWWMCRQHDEELGILLLDAEAVCSRDGVCFCPDNSAYNRYPAETIRTWTGIEPFDACFVNPSSREALFSEVLVPDGVPLRDLRGIVFCDGEAARYWIPIINEVTTEEDDEGPDEIESYVRGTPDYWFRFPPDWEPTRRIRL